MDNKDSVLARMCEAYGVDPSVAKAARQSEYTANILREEANIRAYEVSLPPKEVKRTIAERLKYVFRHEIGRGKFRFVNFKDNGDGKYVCIVEVK